MEKINNENYMEYQDFLDAKTGVPQKHWFLWSLGMALLSLGTAIGIIVGLVPIGWFVWGILERVNDTLASKLVMAMVGSAVCMGCEFIGLRTVLSIAMEYIPMRIFQKKHPDFDITLDRKEVEKELEKYYQLSKIPKDIERKKEVHLTNYSDSMNEMTAEERLEFLKKEKEFWEQVAIQEKYQENGGKTKDQVEIEPEECSIKREEKVYFIHK